MSVMAIMALMVLVSGGCVAALPWMESPTQCFAVTVPPSVKSDARVHGYRRSYLLVSGAVTLACTLTLVALTAAVGPDAEQSPQKLTLLTAGITAATLLPVAASYALMLHYRTRIQDLKKQEDWHADARQGAAIVGSDDAPQPLSLAWNLLYVVLTAATAAFALLHYDRFLSQIPMRAGFDGTVSSYVPKSMGVVLFPALVTTFVGAVMTVSHWMILRSKRPVDPAAPATSAYAYGYFARVQSILMLGGGLLLCASMSLAFFLASMGTVSLGTAGLGVGIVAIAFCIAMFVASFATGQSGARLASELRTNDHVVRDDDRFWKLGMFYFCPEDPSIIVPKRFGMGWTINHARPAAWALIGALIVTTIVFSLAITALVG